MEKLRTDEHDNALAFYSGFYTARHNDLVAWGPTERTKRSDAGFQVQFYETRMFPPATNLKPKRLRTVARPATLELEGLIVWVRSSNTEGILAGMWDPICVQDSLRLYERSCNRVCTNLGRFVAQAASSHISIPDPNARRHEHEATGERSNLALT